MSSYWKPPLSEGFKKKTKEGRFKLKPNPILKEERERRLDHTNLLNTSLKLQIAFLLIWDLNQRLFERHLVNESKAEMNHVF